MGYVYTPNNNYGIHAHKNSMHLQDLILTVDAQTESRLSTNDYSGKIALIPKPKIRAFWWDSLNKPPFLETLAKVATLAQIGKQVMDEYG